MSVSTRVLRKFQENRDFLANKANDDSDSEEIPFSSGARKKQLNVNRYDLLNQQSQSESEVKDDDDEDEDENEKEYVNKTSNDRRVSTRRKKKKKKKKASHSVHRQSSDDMDCWEKKIVQMNTILGETDSRPAQAKKIPSGSSNLKKGIMSVDYKHLNPSNELKRIFGPKILLNEQGKRRGRGHQYGRGSCLIMPKDHWPPPHHKLGLSMKFLETKNDCQYFVFEHSNAYQNVEKKFLEAVESLDPDNLVAIANNHPYHLDTLIQLSDICKLSEDLAMAAELIERALFSLETAFHPLFNIVKGNCRLDYRRQENRALYVTLFKHLVFVGQRACYRTALEFCKLILSLNPEEDPLAIVLAMDFYAIRSREFTWLLQLIEETENERHLTQLPNMAFGRAVALYQLSDPAASAALQDALLMFPGVLLPLLDKCSVQSDSKTRSHSFFLNASSSQPPALNCLVQLYVHRSYHIWKEPEIMNWLEKNTLEVLKRVDDCDPLVEEYAEKRKRRYAANLPGAIDRHLFLSDIKEVTALLAENTTISTTFSFDPLPPADSINIYEKIERPPRTYEHSNAVSLFFRSLMPNFDMVPNEIADGNDRGEVEGDEGAAGRGAALHHSFINILDAVTNLLSNFRTIQAQPPGDDNGSESSGDTGYDEDGDGSFERQV